MMRAFLTGEKGFIAKNLIRVAGNRIAFLNNEMNQPNEFCSNGKGEIDFTSPLGMHVLKTELKAFGCNVIIHNGATVGTDVCGLNPRDAVTNNVYGTYNIATLAKELNIPVVYIGTTVIYDTQRLQEKWITEQSRIFPRTLYATTKYEGELIIRAYCQESRYCILRPLFCYGGEGDMNSLIAKSIFNDVTDRKRHFKIFLDPAKIKDYMHVDDFCEAIVTAACFPHISMSNDDFNIAAESSISTYKIVSKIAQYANVDVNYIQWVPETDYLGNHRVSSLKFKDATAGNWYAKIGLSEGIKMVKDAMIDKSMQGSTYNPFRHLDMIEKNNINIETHYNFKG